MRQDYTAKKSKALFDGLRVQTAIIEKSIAVGELEVLQKDDISFMMRQNELAISTLMSAHVNLFLTGRLKISRNARFLSTPFLRLVLNARRQKRKLVQSFPASLTSSIRASKKRDHVIQQQEKSAGAAARIRESIVERRTFFDAATERSHPLTSRNV
jgi:hypothetical protein